MISRALAPAHMRCKVSIRTQVICLFILSEDFGRIAILQDVTVCYRVTIR
jgi:hypothetical protein